jgi:hypothetical protein
MAMTGSIGRSGRNAPKTDNRRWRSAWWRAAAALFVVSGSVVSGQISDAFFVHLEHTAIEYRKGPTSDLVVQLNRKIQTGDVRLAFEPGFGYLHSVLDALDVPKESQIAVFSKTSAQVAHIDPQHPRTIFFNDAVAVAYTRGGFIELAAHDPRQGVVFYDIPQQPTEKPYFSRQDWCLGCHNNLVTLGVPGMMVRSVATAADGRPMQWLVNYTSDHRSPFERRWGGWYVTGDAPSVKHLGNVGHEEGAIAPVASHLDSLAGPAAGSYSNYSDIVALMVFEHQVYMTNLITRIGWQTRVGLADHRDDMARALEASAADVVDYMLFVDEAPLPGQVRSTSGFAEKFAGEGPNDRHGRSLRQLDLQDHLMRYRCSYMIYTAAFDALPAEAKDAVYRRLWNVLSGQDSAAKYQKLSVSERKAIVEILRDTKKDLPEYFHEVDR